MSEQFKCAKCGGTFDKGWSDGEAVAAAAALFPEGVGDDAATLCDDCHRDFRAWMTANGLTGRLSEDQAKLDAMDDPKPN